MPVDTSSALMTLLPRRHAAGLPPRVNSRMNTGTNAALIAPSAKRSRTRFGMRNATLNASIAFPAPNIEARTWSRASPRMRLAMVAAPADTAERASVDVREEELGAKLAADRFVHGAAVRVLARKARHHGLHPLAHVLLRRRACFGDRRGDRRVNVVGGGGGRQVRLEDADLRRFLVDEVGASRLRELLDRIAALLDQRRHDLQHLGIVEIVPLLDALVHDRRLEHAQC